MSFFKQIGNAISSVFSDPVKAIENLGQEIGKVPLLGEAATIGAGILGGPMAAGATQAAVARSRGNSMENSLGQGVLAGALSYGAGQLSGGGGGGGSEFNFSPFGGSGSLDVNGMPIGGGGGSTGGGGMNYGNAALNIGAMLYSNQANRQAADQASRATQDANAQAMAMQRQMFERQNQLNEPYNAAGLAGQNRLMELMGLGGNKGAAGYGQYAKDFSMDDFQADPGYAFRLKEGNKALDQSAAARGGLISGNALRAAQRYGQDAASQEYTNAFQRYQTNRANQLQPLGNLMSSGQNAAANSGAAAGNFGGNMSNLYSNQGENLANIGMASNLAQQNALAGAVRGIGYGGYGGQSQRPVNASSYLQPSTNFYGPPDSAMNRG